MWNSLLKLFPLYLLLHFFCTLKWTFNCVAPCQNRKRMIQLMCTFSTKGKTISIFPSFEVNTPIIYLNTFSNEGQKVFKAAQAAGCPSFTLVTISDLDWNHDMVPWDGPSAFKNAEPCTGGADDYLRLLTEEIIPTAQQQRRRLLGPLAGAGLLGTLWQGYLRCTPSIRQICFPVWAACPALSGFRE